MKCNTHKIEYLYNKSKNIKMKAAKLVRFSLITSIVGAAIYSFAQHTDIKKFTKLYEIIEPKKE